MSDVADWFAALMVSLAEAYPNFRLREGTVRVYADGLQDIAPEAVDKAMRRAVRECAFFPTVAELRRFVEPTTDDAALMAWSGFQRAAEIVGAYASVNVDDGAAAVALMNVFGGWTQYCELEGQAVGARRQEFVAAYREARRRGEQRSTRLAGLLEVDGHYDAAKSWSGRVRTDGSVRVERDRPQLTGDATRLIGDGLIGDDR